MSSTLPDWVDAATIIKWMADTSQNLNPHPECIDANDDHPLRQGDIFEWNQETEDPWRRFGIVVTADCDIAHNKHRGRLSYVPILLISDYLRLFYLPGVLSQATDVLSQSLAKLIVTSQETYRPDFPQPLSKERALEWARSEDPEDIANELRIEDDRTLRILMTKATGYREATVAMEHQGLDEQMTALQQLRVIAGSTPEQAEGSIRQAVFNVVDGLPGDCFFLRSLSSRLEEGCVVYLRLLREIGDDEIAIRSPQLQTASARRISRLQSPFLYRLTQQLAEVFSAIGLPTAYELRRKSYAASLQFPSEQEKGKGTDGD